MNARAQTMSRAFAVSLWIAAFAAGAMVAHGCGDDRARVARDFFTCDPDSPTADKDCGEGYTCYAAVRALGLSFCVPKCTDQASCHGGVCTSAGECLARCTVGKNDCPAHLACVRTTINSLEAGMNDGVCLPVDSTCNDNQDCTSPVFDLCTNHTNTLIGASGFPAGGYVCAEGQCHANGVACEPGSTCIGDVLGSTSFSNNAPDVCSPNCTKRPSIDGKSSVLECPPTFSCLSTQFPENTPAFCAPGSPGWLCADPLGCVAGSCADWGDSIQSMSGFRTCAPKCNVDADCAPFDQLGQNPSALSKLRCVNNTCRSLVSVFFADACLHDGDSCVLDPSARCHVEKLPDLGGAAPPRECPSFGAPVDAGAPGDLGTSSVSAGPPSICLRACTSDGDCALITAGTHVPHVCIGGACLVPVPVAYPCAGTCLGDLQCMQLSPMSLPTCTRKCAGDSDCANDPALGSGFYCTGGVCTPKVPSGCQSPSSAFCLSGAVDQATGKTCVSPRGWPCDAPDECASGACTTGRCD